jgi:superfamily II DNA or RNA helicase
LLVIDEADQAFGEDVKQYGAILAAAPRYCGLTGTPFRLKDRETAPIFGDGAPFDPPCFSIGKAELVARRRIVPVEPARTSAAFDVSKLRVNDAGFFGRKLSPPNLQC